MKSVIYSDQLTKLIQLASNTMLVHVMILCESCKGYNGILVSFNIIKECKEV